MYEFNALESIMWRMDREQDPIFTVDDLRYWPAGLAGRLMEIGLLRETEPGTTVCCRDCREECILEPDWRVDATTARVVGYYCCGHNVGPLWFDPKELRQWQISVATLADWLRKDLGSPLSHPLEDGSRHMWFLGSVKRLNRRCDAFLGCGLGRADPAQVVSQARRFQASHRPVVLVPHQLPAVGSWGRPLAASAILSEVAQAGRQGIAVAWARVFEAVEEAPAWGPEGSAAAGGGPPDVALRDVELAVLQAMGANGNKAMLLVDITVSSGYGRSAAQAALKRLRSLGLVAKPEGMQRKGDAITAEGRALLSGLARQGPAESAGTPPQVR